MKIRKLSILKKMKQNKKTQLLLGCEIIFQ